MDLPSAVLGSHGDGWHSNESFKFVHHVDMERCSATPFGSHEVGAMIRRAVRVDVAQADTAGEQRRRPVTRTFNTRRLESTSWCSGLADRIQKCFRRFEIGGVKALGEPGVDRLKKLLAIGRTAPISQQPCEACCRAHFPG